MITGLSESDWMNRCIDDHTDPEEKEEMSDDECQDRFEHDQERDTLRDDEPDYDRWV